MFCGFKKIFFLLNGRLDVIYKIGFLDPLSSPLQKFYAKKFFLCNITQNCCLSYVLNIIYE